jgi:thioredoxin reductase (NADPH)
VVTAEELGRVALFAGLSDEGRERLAHGCADVRLDPGEYAVHEGDDRALFAVLEGEIEVVKVVDGVDRVLGRRGPGEIFGEVPITLGSPFPGGFRATAPSRVARIEPAAYHHAAAAVPAIAIAVGKLAGQRIGGLQSIASEPPKPRLTVVGHRWDAECSSLRRFLDRNQISFEWVEPDDPECGRLWPGARPADEECPSIRLADGTTATRPRLREVARLLGLQTEPTAGEYDTVVVGGGPAGLAAAVYGSSEGLRTVVVEREAPGGQAGTSSRIENYLGFPSGVSGDELASRALQQARRLGAEILVTRTIDRIDPATREVVLDDGETLRARTIVLATGVTWRHLEIDGIEPLIGNGVHYGAARSEAPNTHGLDVVLVGAGNSAGQAALGFAGHARSVTIVCRADSLEQSMSQYLIDQLRRSSNVELELGKEIAAVHGGPPLEAVELRDRGTGELERRDCAGLYIFIGADAETGWLPPEIARNDRGYVLTGADVKLAGRWHEERDPYLLETSVPGIFACGDVRLGPVKRVAAAVGEGSMAIAFVHQYLRHSRA